jgi:hypothetical protein
VGKRRATKKLEKRRLQLCHMFCKLHDNNYSCAICSANLEETTFHLFFTCTFSMQCWNHLGINWNFNLPFHAMMENAKQQFNSDFFVETFMLGAWLIWKQRNSTIFNRGRATFQGWKHGFIEEALVQANRMKRDKQISFTSLVNMYR